MERLKILIPTDFSVQAEFSYLMVKKLEEKMAVDVHFLHVLDVPDTVTMDSSGAIETCGEIDIKYVLKQKEIAERNLANLRDQYGNGISTHLLLGKVTDAIVAFSATNQFDLIVMGTKGAWGLKEKLSGTETQMIARRASIPLLSLMCDRSDLQIQNILLVHDFKIPEKEGLDLLYKLINAFNAKLHLLQIGFQKSDSERAGIETDMVNFAALNNITNFECHVIHDRDIENGVIHFNQKSNMDIICIGTHGKGGIFHSSATEKLVNHLFKPIISFHLKHQ